MNRIRTTLRKIAVAGVLGAALPLLVAAPASADQETKLPHGYTPAHADGWFAPGSEVTVQVAGEVLSRATNLAPRNVR